MNTWDLSRQKQRLHEDINHDLTEDIENIHDTALLIQRAFTIEELKAIHEHLSEPETNTPHHTALVKINHALATYP